MTTCRAVHVSALTAALVLASADAASANSSPFLRAYCDAPSGQVQFEAPVPVDWQALALKHVQSLDPDQPSETDVARLARDVGEVTSSTDVSFDAPLVPGMTQGTYAFISSAGVDLVSPVALRGEVSFEFDTGRRAIVRTTYSGRVVAKTASASPGGFVHWSIGKGAPVLMPNVSATLRDEGGGRTLSYHGDGGSAAFALSESNKRAKSKTIVAAFGFRIATARYLFIAWSPDDACHAGCCQHDFEIFRVRDALEPVAANAFDCDP